MRVELVNGSPNRNGSTSLALAEVAKTLEEAGIETHVFWIGPKPVGGCMGCGKCAELGRCVIDDKVNDFRELARAADGFVFGSPVHFASLSGTMTAFMDRVLYAGNEGLKNKPAACLVSARRAGTTAALDQLLKYPMYANMPIVATRYWPMVHGNAPADVEQDLEGLQIMRQMARNMVWMLQCIQAGSEAGVPLPEHEEARIATNFVR